MQTYAGENFHESAVKESLNLEETLIIYLYYPIISLNLNWKVSAKYADWTFSLPARSEFVPDNLKMR